LRVRETIVSSLPFESRISRISPCLHPPEKSFEGKIYAHLNILENLRMNSIQFGPFLLPLCQDLVGLVERDGMLFLFPGILSQCKSIVIDPPTDLKRLLKQSYLRL
ncbi:MAG: hypothetical protein WBL10_00025, partial [Candidatus Methanoculleus thermohydrogenotrophicum]